MSARYLGFDPRAFLASEQRRRWRWLQLQRERLFAIRKA